MKRNQGVYIMRVASMLTGMHPQTLRKYERAGLLVPTRSKKLRMYSEEDIDRLKIIKQLVDEVGLNLAGVRLVLELRDSVLKIKSRVDSIDISPRQKVLLLKPLKESLAILNNVMDNRDLDLDLESQNTSNRKK